MNQHSISRRKILSLFSTGLVGLWWTSSTEKEYLNIVNNKNLHKMINTENQLEQKIKTIGILGGIGPQATMDLEKRIHNASREIIQPQGNSGYPPMAVQYYRHAPVLLTEDHQPFFPFRVDPRLLTVATNLGTAADFILIASNGIHLFQQEIEKASGREVLSMIDLTINEVKKRNWKKVGVLGLMNAKIYTIPLEASGIICETISDDLQEKLNRAVFKVMEGTNGEDEKKIAMDAITQLRSKDIDGIIPGCTEIPLMIEQEMNTDDLINPIQILAEAAVRYSIQ